MLYMATAAVAIGLDGILPPKCKLSVNRALDTDCPATFQNDFFFSWRYADFVTATSREYEMISKPTLKNISSSVPNHHFVRADPPESLSIWQSFYTSSL